MRVLALYLPDLPLQRLARGRGDSGPLAIADEGRITHADAAALAEGVQPGESAVQAQARSARLTVVPLDAAADRAALVGLAEALMLHAPAVEIAGGDALLLDASA